jgi:hypothetical protein
MGLGAQFLSGGRVDSEDGKGGVFGTNFLDIVKTLEIPCVHIYGDGIPAAACKRLE